MLSDVNTSATWRVLAVPSAALVLATVALILFGVIGVGRAGVAHDDVSYFYAAARMWFEGINPYSLEAFQAANARYGLDPEIGVYPYPPHSLVLWAPLVFVDYATAQHLWTGMNLAITAALAFGMGQWVVQRSPPRDAASALATRCWVATIVIGNPFTSHVLWTGQTGLLILGSLVLAWNSLHQRRVLLAGACIFVASIKPQLSLLPIFWLLLTGRWQPLLTAAALAAVALAVVMSSLGVGIMLDWVRSMLNYQSGLAVSLPYNANLASLLLGLGMPPSGTMRALLMAAALGYVAALAWLRGRDGVHEQDALAALLLASLFLIFGRDYDIVVLAPVVAAMWWHAGRSRGKAIVALALLLLLCVPQRLVTPLAIQPLQFWRIALLGVLLVWLTLSMATARARTGRIELLATRRAL